MFTLTVNGSYPCYPQPPRPQLLAQAQEDFRHGRIDEKTLSRALERATIDAVVEMVAAGIEVVTDGQLRWDDSETGWAAYICSRLNGFDVSRGNNGSKVESLPARITANDTIQWRRPIVLQDYQFLSERSPVAVRPVISGPFSIAMMCDPGVYKSDLDRLMQDLAAALNREIEGLQEAGAQYILVDEPLLTSNKDQIDSFMRCSEILCKNSTAKVMLGTSHGDLTGIEVPLAESPFDGICFDLAEGAENESILTRPGFWGDKILQLGLIDVNQDHVQPPIEISVELVKYAACHDPHKIWVSPSSGLRNLNRKVVFDKLTSMSQGAEWARREIERREIARREQQSET